MSEIERMTVTLPAEMAALVRGAVEEGDYALSSEVVREALRVWKMTRAERSEKLAALRRDIDAGLRDIADGKVVAFDPEDIMTRGRLRSAGRSQSGQAPPPVAISMIFGI